MDYGRNSTNRQTAAVALTMVALVALGISWSWRLGEPFSFDYDEGVYLVSARSVLHGHALYRETFSFQPPLYVELLRAAFLVFGDNVTVGRGVSLVFALAVCAALAKASWDAIHPWAAPATVVFCGTALSFFHGARVVQAEMPALGFAMGAIATVAAPWRARQVRWQLVSGALFGLAVASKLFTAPVALPIVTMVCWGAMARRSGREMIRSALVFSAATAGVLFIVCAPYDLREVYSQGVGFHLDARGAQFPWAATRLPIRRFLLGEGPWRHWLFSAFSLCSASGLRSSPGAACG